MEILLALLLVVGIIAYDALCWGFVLYKFWYWFLLPVFQDMPHVGYMQCVGLLFVLGGLFKNNTNNSDDENKWLNLLLTPWFSLIIGWVFHQFI